MRKDLTNFSLNTLEIEKWTFGNKMPFREN